SPVRGVLQQLLHSGSLSPIPSLRIYRNVVKIELRQMLRGGSAALMQVIAGGRSSSGPFAAMPYSELSLLQACSDARIRGGDFPTIWNVILRTHPLVVGAPVSRT